MRTDTIIIYEGMKALREKLDIVETEKFISLILRENFDYTEWQRNLWKNKTVDEIFYAAKNYEENINKEGYEDREKPHGFSSHTTTHADP